MTPASSTHLSEEAFDDVLIGLGSPESETHLAVCEDCWRRINSTASPRFSSASTSNGIGPGAVVFPLTNFRSIFCI